MAGEAHPAVRAGLRALGLYDPVGTLRLGHDVADCPLCRQMMRVDGWRFRCYAQCEHDAIAAALASDARFTAAAKRHAA